MIEKLRETIFAGSHGAEKDFKWSPNPLQEFKAIPLMRVVRIE